MKKNINKIILMGFVGAAPEKRYLPNGVAVVSFSLSTEDHWTDILEGESLSSKDWHSVLLYGPMAEAAFDALGAGEKVYLEGKSKKKDVLVCGVSVPQTFVLCASFDLVDDANYFSEDAEDAHFHMDVIG
ncbi:MAG: single-stranded DNA-binding protein [Cellvibrionaceae bacterium]